MSLSNTIAVIVKLTRYFSRSGNDRIGFAQGCNDRLNSLLTRHLEVVSGRVGRFVRLEGIFAYQQCDRSAFSFCDFYQIIHTTPGSFGLRQQDAMGNIHCVQQTHGDLALFDVLWLVFRARFTPPADE